MGVKSAKRLIRDNTGPSGSLNTNQFHQALLAHRNCPDSTSKVSPAQIVYGHAVRDLIPAINYTPREEWSTLARKREDCFLKRHYKKCEPLEANARELQQILPGDNVFIQDQTGPTPKRWSKSGVILESLPHDVFSFALMVLGIYQGEIDAFLGSLPPLISKKNHTQTNQAP